MVGDASRPGPRLRPAGCRDRPHSVRENGVHPQPAKDPIPEDSPFKPLTSSLQLAFAMTAFAAVSCVIVAGFTSDAAAVRAVLLSAGIAVFNALCALLLTHLGSLADSTKGFFGAVLGGMVLRMGT